MVRKRKKQMIQIVQKVEDMIMQKKLKISLFTILVIAGSSLFLAGLTIELFGNNYNQSNKVKNEYDTITSNKSIFEQKECLNYNLCLSKQVLLSSNYGYSIDGEFSNESDKDISNIYATVEYNCNDKIIYKTFSIFMLGVGEKDYARFDFENQREIMYAKSFKIREATEEEINQYKLENDIEE